MFIVDDTTDENGWSYGMKLTETNLNYREKKSYFRRRRWIRKAD